MTQKDSAQEHVQGFRSVQRSEPHSTTSVPLDSLSITHIDCYTDPDTNKDFILWEDIQQAFDEALFVRNKTRMLPFMRGKDHRVLEPRRIAAVSDVVLDVVVADKPIAATDTETADMIASLQRAVQELSLNIPRQTPVESAIHNPPCGDEPEATQDNNHIDSPENTTPLRGPQALECHSQDNYNGNTIDTQCSEATSNAAKRLDDPQDETAAKDMDLMQTMIHANQGDVHAQVALGDRYKDGREVHRDCDTALDWYLKAAEQHHPRAQYNIGLLYKEKHDKKRDYEEEDYMEEGYREEYDRERDDVASQDGTNAFEWFLKSALQGYANAQAKVSQAYTNGAGIPKDNIKAMEWSVKAAENGHAGMQYNMGAAYEKGQGVPQSDSRSFEWYLKSAEQGFAKSQERVAAALETGRGVWKNGLMAVEWYTKAADQGLPVAQFTLGRVHKLGLCGLPKDRSKAVDWLIKAAAQGHTEAQSMLSEIYNYGTSYRGPDCTIDLETQSKIEEWFMDAADQGVAHAQVCMADMYAKGLGVLKNESKAFEWLLKAAEQGNEASQRRIAHRYETGLGVAESREKSLEWYLKLAKEGNGWALHILKYMLRN